MDLDQRLRRLERGLVGWKTLCLVQSAVLVTVALTTLLKPVPVANANDGVLRGRGLIITDNNGRARVLLGAPLPETKERLRRDSGYEAMVFLDEQGHDRISLGQEMPAQVNGVVPTDRHRIASGYGFIIHDPRGNERGGFGFLDNGRAVMALDRPNGDAWAAMVDDSNGFAGTLSIYDRSIGENATGIFSGTQGKRAFIDLKDYKDRPREQFQIGADGKPLLHVLGENGSIEQDLIGGTPK